MPMTATDGAIPGKRMIIKSLFGRYEKWNPVHPTTGAFWGIGVGLGCGIGWGPGFGPEVVGYVGAGCGVGLNVGFTLLGFGIGFPANHLYTVPVGAYTLTRRSVIDGAPMLVSRAKQITDSLQRVGEQGRFFPWDKDLKD